MFDTCKASQYEMLPHCEYVLTVRMHHGITDDPVVISLGKGPQRVSFNYEEQVWRDEHFATHFMRIDWVL